MPTLRRSWNTQCFKESLGKAFLEAVFVIFENDKFRYCNLVGNGTAAHDFTSFIHWDRIRVFLGFRFFVILRVLSRSIWEVTLRTPLWISLGRIAKTSPILIPVANATIWIIRIVSSSIWANICLNSCSFRYRTSRSSSRAFRRRIFRPRYFPFTNRTTSTAWGQSTASAKLQLRISIKNQSFRNRPPNRNNPARPENPKYCSKPRTLLRSSIKTSL